MGGNSFNDYMALPLAYNKHVSSRGHITFNQLEEQLSEDPKELIMFCLGLYIKYVKGEYDIDADRENGFMEFRRKREGIV